ncbi:MAG: T9SS type A sorting domain-containing protein [Bacteroidaceae bacterium]|nr:T9SS type A sorting domain-containing protein [Bacteroidaceae bacterium]
MQQNYIKQMLMLLAFISVPWLSAHATDYMNVFLTSQGSFQSINIDEIDKITFPSEDEVNITMSGVVMPMAIENIEVITFGDTDITAIEEIEEERVEVEIIYIASSGEVRITSPEVINQVQLYNMQGVLMQSLTPRVETATLDVSNYPTGIYIVAVQSKGEIETKKIIIN